MTHLSPSLRRTLRAATPALALACLALPPLAATAADSFKPNVLFRFSGTADNTRLGAGPQVPPVLTPDGQLQGHTFLGGPGLTLTLGQGTSYRLDALTGANFKSYLLGDISTASTTLVQDSQGVLYGGAAASNYNNDTSVNMFNTTPALFSLKAGQAAPLPHQGLRPRGQLAIDGQDNIYLASGEAPSACNTTENKDGFLWRMTTDGSTAKVLDFCQYAVTVGRLQLHPKGGSPVANVWSAADKALYVLTAVNATGVFDASAASDNAGRSVGTLVKISQAALDEGVANNGVLDAAKVEVLHTFLRNRDGAPTATGGRLTGLVEAGEWLYGTSYSNTPTNVAANDLRYSGTLWRVKKSDPTSFTVLHRFRGTDTLGRDGSADADGATPSGPLVLAKDGNIYGTTTRDGRTMMAANTGLATPVGAGTLFRIVVGQAADHADDRYEVLHRFDLGTDGGAPVGLNAGQVINGVQKLYGAARAGGNGETISADVQDPAGLGTVFSIDVPLPTVAFTTALTASASSAKVGDTLRLSWATSNAASCTASGDNGNIWRGAQQTSGNQVPLAGVLTQVGANTFSLSCESNNGGPPARQTVTVNVEAPAVTPPVTGSTGGGGGGPLGAALLAPLAGLWLLRRQRRTAAR